MWLLGLMLMLAMAAVVGAAAHLLVSGRLPGGLYGTIGAGLLGTWIGGWLFKEIVGNKAVGPVVAGIAVVPAVAGAIVVVVLIGLATGRRADDEWT